MKKTLTVLMMALATNAFAFYENPHEKFDMTRNKTNDVKIKFIQAKNVTQACEAESRRRGFNGFGIALDACSFYNYNYTECTIITPLVANFHTLGHEVRHCLQGAFHK